MINKTVIAMAFAVTAAAIVSAEAAPLGPVNNPDLLKVRPGATIRIGDACWKQTDGGRGFGYWTNCDNSVPFTQAAGPYNTIDANGGGIDSGDGGGGGGEGGGER